MALVNKERDNDRVYWHSRRGMLEIDLKLMPFAKKAYPHLSDQDKQVYKTLLEEEDTQLFAWVLQREKPENAELAVMMEKILAFAKESGHST